MATNTVAGQFGDFQRGFRQIAGGMQAAFSAVNVGSKLASGALGAISMGLRAFTGALTEPLSAIQGLVQAITGFVELANPAVVQQFGIALRDAMAVMGGMLTPVMQGMTVATRAFGDVMAQLQPVLQPLFNQFGQLFADWATIFREVMRAAAPLIQVMADAMVDALKDLAAGFAFLEGIVVGVYEAVAKFFGLTSRRDPNRNSIGAAVRQTKVSSVEGFASDVFAKSLQGIFGVPGGRKPEEAIPDILNAINDGKKVVEDIANNVKAILDWFQNKKQQADNVAAGVTSPVGGAGSIAVALGKMFVR